MSLNVTQESQPSGLVTASLMTISPLIGCYLSIWLAHSTRPLIGPLSLDLVSVSTPWSTLQTLMTQGIKCELYYICGQRSASSVSDVTGGYVLYQIRLLPYSRVISHNILITIVNL